MPPGVRAEIAFVILAAIALPALAAGVVVLRAEPHVVRAFEAEVQQDVDDARLAVDARIAQALVRVTAAAASHAGEDAIEHAGGPAWLVHEGSIRIATADAPRSRDGDAVFVATIGHATHAAPSAVFVAAEGDDGILVRLLSEAELFSGAPTGTRLALSPEGLVASPLATVSAYSGAARPPSPLALWRFAGFGLIAFLVAAGGVATVMLTERIVRPLRRLEADVRAFGEGQRERRARIEGSAETASLAREFNALSDALAAHEAALAARARRLHEDVRDLEFAAAHDFREALRSIALITGMVLADAEDRLREDELELLRSGHVAARHLEAVAADVGRIVDASTRPLAPVPVDVAGALEEALGNVEGHDRVRLRLEGVGKVQADAAALTEILRELAANALKFDDGNGVVEIHGGFEGDSFVLHVDDEGPGIPGDHREDVFIPFRRLDPRDARAGTGAGLAIVKRLAERHGGSVGIDASPLGGTRVTVRLPIVPRIVHVPGPGRREHH